MSSQLRPASPSSSSSASSSRQRTTTRPSHNNNKSNRSFHLNNLPRFHPAVYQSQSMAATTSNQAPQQPTSSPLAQQQYHYNNNNNNNNHHPQRPAQPSRMPSASRDALRQYRDLIAGVALTPRGTTGSISSKPSKPRLDPLGSPGPVTPLALEDEGGYLVAGEKGLPTNNDHHAARGSSSSMSADELVQNLIKRENERIRGQESSSSR